MKTFFGLTCTQRRRMCLALGGAGCGDGNGGGGGGAGGLRPAYAVVRAGSNLLNARHDRGWMRVSSLSAAVTVVAVGATTTLHAVPLAQSDRVCQCRTRASARARASALTSTVVARRTVAIFFFFYLCFWYFIFILIVCVYIFFSKAWCLVY